MPASSLAREDDASRAGLISILAVRKPASSRQHVGIKELGEGQLTMHLKKAVASPLSLFRRLG